MASGNLSTTDLTERIRRLEKQILNGNTPRELTLGDLQPDIDIDEVDTLVVNDEFTTPVYESEDDVPPLQTGQIVTIEDDGLYVEV